jgi:hypothetical protein
MSSFLKRVLVGVGAVILCASTVLAGLVGAPSSASAAPSDLCAAVDKIVGEDAAAAAQLAREIFVGGGDADVAAAIVACLDDEPEADEDAGAAVCDIADALNAAEKHAETVELIEAYRGSTPAADDTPCDAQLKAAQGAGALSTSPEDLGTLWSSFQKKIFTPLTSVALFVGGFVLVLLAIARLLALLKPFRDPRFDWGRRWTRFGAWVAGIALALTTATLFASRGMWLMRAEGPLGDPAPNTMQFPNFLGSVLGSGLTWWWLVFLPFLLASLLLLTYAFASKMRVTLEITKSKDDGTSLDVTRLMAAIDGMAGRANRGLEYPVGTDLTTASAAVKEISDNKAVAAVQTALKAIFGTSPWRLAIENEAADAASIAISRNGVLITAKRVRIADGHPLADLSEPLPADRLAALIAGELVAALRGRYAADFDPSLHGATRGESLALQYMASSALAGSQASRASAMPVLARAVEKDPGNRAAWTTLANFAYRDPITHALGLATPHQAYRDFLRRAIDDELRLAPERSISKNGTRRERADEMWKALSDPGKKAPSRWLRENALLVRLVQAEAAASANLHAVDRADDPNPTITNELWALRVILHDGRRDRHELPIDRASRRQLLLIDDFRRTKLTTNDELLTPALLERTGFENERAAWNRVSPSNTPTLEARFACEDAVLGACSDYAHDPYVAYALACYRAESWWRPYENLGGTS